MSSRGLWRLILFYWAFFETVAKSHSAVRMKSTDYYGLLAYNGATLLHIPVYISRAFLVLFLK